MFYRFIADPNCIPAICSGSFKFSLPEELNDPADLVPSVIPDEVKKSLEYLRHNGIDQAGYADLLSQHALLLRLAPTLARTPRPTSIEEINRQLRYPHYDKIDLLIEYLYEVAKEFRARVGVACLTKKLHCLPMWAHYARNAKGVCVEYGHLDSVFSGDETRVLNEVRAVNYNRNMNGVTFQPSTYTNLFLAKFSDWEYEMEYRVVTPLDTCGKLSPSSAPPIYTRQIPENCIKNLYLGWRVEKSEGEIMKEVFLSGGHERRVYTSKIYRGEIVFEQLI